MSVQKARSIILAELDALEKEGKFINSDIEVSKDETVIDEMTPFERACFTWLEQAKEKEGEIIKTVTLRLGEHGGDQKEFDGHKSELFVLSLRAKGVAQLLLMTIRDRLDLWNMYDFIGIRKGFKIVRTSNTGNVIGIYIGGYGPPIF